MTIAFVPWSSLSPIVGLEAYVTNWYTSTCYTVLCLLVPGTIFRSVYLGSYIFSGWFLFARWQQ
jgi:hypothetical protein